MHRAMARVPNFGEAFREWRVASGRVGRVCPRALGLEQKMRALHRGPQPNQPTVYVGRRLEVVGALGCAGRRVSFCMGVIDQVLLLHAE
jgi:hypothetical protein